jgi:hypothetical protein
MAIFLLHGLHREAIKALDLGAGLSLSISCGTRSLSGASPQLAR